MPMKMATTLPRDDLTFTEWAVDLGMSNPAKLIHHLCEAYREGRVCILDRPSYQALFQATLERTLRETRKVARQEARNLLFEMGFTPK